MTEATSETLSKPVFTSAELVQACCRALDNKKADNIKILYLGPKSTVADYFVIVTGTSSPHLRAMRIVLEKELDSKGSEILGMDMNTDSGWAVVDAGNIIFHLFTKAMRETYALENLWKDADLIPLELEEPEVKPVAKTVAKAKSAAPKAKKVPKAKKAKE